MNPPTDRRPGLLAVDDDSQIRRFLATVFEKLGVRAWFGCRGAEGVDLYREHRGEIGLVLLDVQMPGLDGPGTLARLQALDPAVRCWFMSGDTGAYTERSLRDLGACGLLSKPFNLAALQGVLASMPAPAPG